MTDSEILSYIQAAAKVVGLNLDPARAEAVAVHFGRTLGMARLLEGAPLAPEHELAALYCPAPFPAQDAPSGPNAPVASNTSNAALPTNATTAKDANA